MGVGFIPGPDCVGVDFVPKGDIFELCTGGEGGGEGVVVRFKKRANFVEQTKGVFVVGVAIQIGEVRIELDELGFKRGFGVGVKNREVFHCVVFLQLCKEMANKFTLHNTADVANPKINKEHHERSP